MLYLQPGRDDYHLAAICALPLKKIMRKKFIYTQTRLQARHGMRPDERTWQLVESQKDLANFLQSARQTSLKNWVMGLQATDTHHLIESSLLNLYRDYINDIASWVPHSWRKSVEWSASITYLPALQHLLSGNTVQEWMLQDPVLKQFTTTHLEQRTNAFLQSEYAPLIHAWQAGESLLSTWIRSWQSLWPEKRTKQKVELEIMIALLSQHLTSFMHVAPNTAWRHRQQLAQKLTLLFRKYSFHPVAVFIHLLLIAMDVERLRGGIMQRCLFPGYREESA